MERTFAEETLARAITVLGDERADEDEREDAALVIGTIIGRASVFPSEADITDLLIALERALHVNLAIRRVLGGVQRLEPAQVVERAGRGVERMMGRVHRDGDHKALVELLLVAFEEPRWISWVRDDWGRTAMTWAVSHLPETKYAAAFIVSGWLHTVGRVPTWMGEIVEEQPDLVTSTLLPLATRWQLHTAAPSVAGWHHLVGVRGAPPTIEPALFGHVADVAVTTLEQAIGETPNDKATETVLRRWLHELTVATA